MPGIKTVRSVLNEYGIKWAVNRALYSAKLKTLRAVPQTERLFEKSTPYPKRTDIFLIDTDELRSMLASLSEEDRQSLILSADKAASGSICGFSSVELNYGSPIDWQLNPLTGKRCDERQKWYRIPDFDGERGDIKVIWEASRFSHFITLARAYLLTGDRKYSDAFSGQLSQWLEGNKYGLGANFKCGQECALRMVNALLAFSVFNSAGATGDGDEDNIKELVGRCYRKILSNFFYAYKCIKNNHTVSELMGMIIGAWCCEDDKQLSKAFIMLDKVIQEQFTADGGYAQFSFNYQRLVLQDLECVLAIEQRVGRHLSENSKRRLESAALLMYECQDESGDVPNYGSNDGALVFPVTACGYRDYRPVINTVYALIKGEQLYAGGEHREELVWFSAGTRVDDIPQKSLSRTSSAFYDAGVFTLRGRNSWAMLLLNDYKSRPAHFDQLHFDLWADGVNIFCDAGTYSYASDLGRVLVSNESHNTAVAGKLRQMNSRGPFMVLDWTRRESVACDGNSFEGKSVSANGYAHSRAVLAQGNTYRITDCVTSEAQSKYTVAFHTPCEAEVTGNKASLFYNGRKVCTVECSGTIASVPSKRSLYYLKEDTTTCLLTEGNAGEKIVTVITLEGEDKQ